MNFEKIRSGKLLLYKLKANLTSELALVLAEEIKREIEKDSGLDTIVFDFRIHEIEPKAFKVFAPVGLELRKNHKQMYMLSEKKSVRNFIKSEGMDSIILPIESLQEIKPAGSSSGLSNLKMDVEFINPFIDGTIHVLQVQCQTEVIPGKPDLKSRVKMSAAPADIAGIIGVASPSFNGSIALCFPEKTFLTLMSRMLGEEFTEVNSDLQDGAGELLNMIFGYAKKILNEKGRKFEMALPTVARGSQLSINHVSPQGGTILIPFLAQKEDFWMEIAFGKSIQKKEDSDV